MSQSASVAQGKRPAVTFYLLPVTRHSAGEARVMHLHFVQSLEPLQGAGLGQAALSLHLAMRGKSVHGSGVSVQSDPPPASVSKPQAPSSILITPCR
jgi:hypothetical protein